MQLREATGLNVAVSIRTENSILFIRTFDVRSVRYAAKIGEQGPLHATAAGKIFLAYAGTQDRCGLPEGYELEKLTAHTITNLKSLKKELGLVRHRGFACCDREEILQISGIGAPVFDYQSRVLASISLWAPTKLARMDALLKHSDTLIEFSNRVSTRFGSMIDHNAV